MALTADTKPSVYQGYIAQPPRDADPLTLGYLLGLKPMITRIRPRGLSAIIDLHATREFTGKRAALRTDKSMLMSVAAACRRYQIVYGLPQSNPTQERNNSLVVGMDEFAAFLAIVYEADIRKIPSVESIQQKNDAPTTYWSGVADESRKNIGSHELSFLIRTGDEILDLFEEENGEESTSVQDSLSSLPNYPGLAFIGESANGFADESAGVVALSKTNLQYIAEHGAADQPDEVLDVLRIGYDFSRLTTEEPTITSPTALKLLAKAPSLGARVLLRAWQHAPNEELTSILSRILTYLDEAHQKNPGKVILPKDLDTAPYNQDALKAFLKIKED